MRKSHSKRKGTTLRGIKYRLRYIVVLLNSQVESFPKISNFLNLKENLFGTVENEQLNMNALNFNVRISKVFNFKKNHHLSHPIASCCFCVFVLRLNLLHSQFPHYTSLLNLASLRILFFFLMYWKNSYSF